MHLAFYNDLPAGRSAALHESFSQDKTLSRLREIDRSAREGGLEALDSSDSLVAIGTEVDASGKVTKNSYGVLNLAWQAAEHPEWAAQVAAEVKEIRERIHTTHGVALKHLIWAGMGGSVEDKSMYTAVGLLKKSPACYSLDSTDPAKLKCILEDIAERSSASMPAVLRSTLIVGMAMGMTSQEPVVNLEKLSALYAKHKVDGRPNFVYMTLPGSLLDKFAGERGYRKVELQLDGGNSTAGRHSAPLTRGSLYPLALAGVDLAAWMAATALSDEEVDAAWRLSAFLQSQGEAGRDKVTLLLPKEWAGAGLWTKQNFEESLGKSEDIGLKMVIQEKVKLANYRSRKDASQDRVFLAVQIKGSPHPEAQKIAMLRRAGYPVAVMTAPKGALLSHYMQFMHYVVCGLGVLRKMNFVTQPSVELYKSITSRVYAEAQQAGGTEKTAAWQQMAKSPKRVPWRGLLTLHYDGLAVETSEKDAPKVYALLLRGLAESRKVEYGELTYFGDTRYCERGRKLRRVMERAGERVFRSKLKMPVDVYEGPAMNHSYHEMIIGHGKCFSTVLYSEKQEQLPAAGYTSAYHSSQFLATKLALQERGRPVVALVMKDLGEKSVAAVEEFFRLAALAV